MNKDFIKDIPVNKLFNSISVSVINYDRNREMLQNMPHKRILDLALIIKWCEDSSSSEASEFYNLTNDIKEYWNVDSDLLIDMAKVIASHSCHVILSPLSSFVPLCEEDISGVFLLTNSMFRYGASLICYDEILEYVYNFLKSDYYIVPSSIEEVIIIKKEQMIDTEMIKDTIFFVNNYHLKDDEFLSNNLYCYNGDEKVLKIV